jgi:transposase
MERIADLSQLSVEGLHDLIRQLFATVQTLSARVRELEGQLSKNSKNSSKPPSSDGLKKTTSQRKPSGNKPGGQPGHEGKTLERAETPDVVVLMDLPAQCDVCGTALAKELAQVDQCRQVIDIPVMKYEVTEYRTLRLRCACGKLHSSEFVLGVDEVVQYGPNIRALAVHLTQGQLLPLARCCELLRDLYGLDISPATICAWIEDAAQRVMPSVGAVKERKRKLISAGCVSK